jgi:hypothetical protein
MALGPCGPQVLAENHCSDPLPHAAGEELGHRAVGAKQEALGQADSRPIDLARWIDVVPLAYIEPVGLRPSPVVIQMLPASLAQKSSVNEVPAAVRLASHERRASSVPLPDKDGAGIEKGQNDGKIGSIDLAWKPQFLGTRCFTLAGISLAQFHSVHLFGPFPPALHLVR